MLPSTAPSGAWGNARLPASTSSGNGVGRAAAVKVLDHPGVAHRARQLPFTGGVVAVDQYQPSVPYGVQVVGREPRALQYGGEVAQRLQYGVQPRRVRPGHGVPVSEQFPCGCRSESGETDPGEQAERGGAVGHP